MGLPREHCHAVANSERRDRFFYGQILEARYILAGKNVDFLIIEFGDVPDTLCKCRE
jgi:hypothetical protein